MKMYQLLLLLMAGFFDLQCKKDNQKTEALTSNKWKRGLIDKNVSSNPRGRILYYAVLTCAQDDVLEFNPGGTLKINYGANKCDSSETGTGSLTYSYNRVYKELVIDAVKYTLAEESDNQIKYFVTVPSTTGYEHIVYLLARP
jgi:hypothetical protein